MAKARGAGSGSESPQGHLLEYGVVEHAAFDRAAEGALLPSDGVVGVLLLDAVLHLRVEPVPAVVLADPGPVRAVRQPFPADVVGSLADVLAANDDVGPLRAFITLVAVQRDGLVVRFDLAAVEADRDEGFDQGLAVLEAGGAFDVV